MTPITVKSSTSKTSPPAGTPTLPGSSGKVSLAGVNIAGFDFGITTDGSVSGSFVDPGQNGIDQMNHFIRDTGLNHFRLPIGWQYLVDGLGGALSSTFDAYDNLMQGCLASGAVLCVIDLHNYARWDGGIIGQGGPTNDQFASVWTQLADKYKSNAKIAFGLMNEPHDLDVNTWAATVQYVVTAIRNTGSNVRCVSRCSFPLTFVHVLYWVMLSNGS